MNTQEEITMPSKPMRPSDYGSPEINWGALTIASLTTLALVGLIAWAVLT